MEVTMNKLNYWFHDHKAKRESYTALQSVELKVPWKIATAITALNSSFFPLMST